MSFTPSPRLAASAIMRGYSIQGGKILDNVGSVWHEFATHAEAVAALEAFMRGIEIGKEIGADDARKAVREALGV